MHPRLSYAHESTFTIPVHLGATFRELSTTTVHWPNRLPKYFRYPKLLAIHDDNMYTPIS